MKIYNNLQENIKYLNERLGIDKSFDVVGKEIKIGDTDAYLLMIDGFAKDNMMLQITQRLQGFSEDLNTLSVEDLIKKHIGYMEAEVFDDFDMLEAMVLSGATALIIDGKTEGVIIDAREYPVRSVSEPELEKVTRGPRDGFVETIIFNTALIRRRVKDPNLRFEIKTVGKRTKTNITISYIKDLVDPKYIEELHDKIDKIQIDALTMAEKTLTDLLLPKKWYNPLPQVRYTERPDVCAAHLFEGHVIIIVDGTPSVIILPTTIFHFTQHAEDYYFNPLVGTYIRWVRFIAIITSLLLVPIFLLLSEYLGEIPILEKLRFIIPDEGNIPVLLQVFLIEIGIDLLRISSTHTPNTLSSSLGIIGGLILGDLAIKVGWFSESIILCMAVVGLGTFATPSVEFAMAVRIFRLFLELATGLFKLPGFIISIIIIGIIICTTKNGSKNSYIWPVSPFNWQSLKHIIFREPIPKVKKY